MLDLDYISHNYCPRPKGVSWPWTKVIYPRSRSQWHIPHICVRAIAPLTAMLDLDNISNNCPRRSKGVSWPRPMNISPKSRSQCTHYQNSCLDHNSSLSCWIWSIFHTIVIHDPRVYHDFDQRSYLQDQGHSAHIPKIVWAITPHCHVGYW